MAGKRFAVFMRSYVHILCSIGRADRVFADHNRQTEFWRTTAGLQKPPSDLKWSRDLSQGLRGQGCQTSEARRLIVNPDSQVIEQPRGYGQVEQSLGEGVGGDFA